MKPPAKNKKYTSPAYYEANRLETGLNHIDYGKFTYSHIAKEDWEAIFGPKDSGSDTSEGQFKAHTSKEFEVAMR